MSKINVLSSFRDPSGHIYVENDVVFRQVNLTYKEDYDCLMQSGLYAELIRLGLLIPHQEIERASQAGVYYKIIQPELVSFISYPYEWSFNQLKDAALLTLEIQEIALKFGMCLKDASAYNIQFKQGRPVLIDTLSFQRYSPGKPWVAYRQFCQHFLAPLVLMSFVDLRLSQLLKVHLDGIPLDLASSILPLFVKIKPSIFMHIVLHAKSQSLFVNNKKDMNQNVLSLESLGHIIDDLKSGVRKLVLKQTKSPWGNYYRDCHYAKEDFEYKKKIVNDMLEQAGSKKVWDLGANQGVFSLLAAQKGVDTVAFDSDPLVIDRLYLECCDTHQKLLQPLVVDLINPSPAIGWMNQERLSLLERSQADTVMLLAVIHHLAISNNLPFSYISNFLSQLGEYLIVEFIPKTDPQVQEALLMREDIFPHYDQPNFEREFQKLFTIERSEMMKNSSRILYLMKRKHSHA